MTLGLEAIWIIVLLELITAFGVGAVCLVFSCNLLRALSDSSSDSSSDIGLGHSFPTNEPYKSTVLLTMVDEDGELDSQRDPTGVGVWQSFFSYLRIW